MSNMLKDYDEFKQKMKDILLILAIVFIAIIAWFYLQNNPILENSLGTIDPTVEIIEKENNEENEVISGDKKTVPVSKPTQTTTNRSNLPTIQNGSYLIYYFDDGFYPNTLQVRQGSSIRYINKSEGAMRIFASDQKKLMFRELNQPTTVGNGGTYDFTFTQTGVWFYTNYNNKVHKASVLVY